MNLKELSGILNVSVGTISRVLNNHPSVRISDAKREYVVEGARRYGYRPSLAARSLAKQKTLNVAFVLHHKSSVLGVVNPFPVMDVMMSLQKALQEDRYGLNLIFISRDQPELDFIHAVQGSRSFDAVIFPSGVASKIMIDFAAQNDVPRAIIWDFQSVDWNSNYFHVDVEHDIHTAVEYLKDKGHKDIAIVGWESADIMVEGAYTKIAAEIVYNEGLTIQNDWVISAPLEQDEFISYRDYGRWAMKQIFSSKKTPTAIIASRDMMALGIIDILEERRVVVGKEIDVIGHGNVEGLSLSHQHTPILTTFDPPIAKMTQAAAKAILKQIDDNNVPNIIKSYPSQLIQRNSA